MTDSPADAPPSPYLSCRVVRAVAATALAASALILLGWAFDIRPLTGPGSATTKANGAVSVALCSLAVLLYGSGDIGPVRRVAWRAAAALALLLGVGTLAEYLLHVRLYLDEVTLTSLITDRPDDAQILPSGCIAYAATALGLLIAKSGRAHRTGELMIVVSALVATASTIGFAAGSAELYVRREPFTPMGLYGALLILVLDLSVLGGGHTRHGLFASLSSQHAGGQAARRLLPWALLLPAAIAAAIHQIERMNLINVPLGVGIMAAGVTACLTGAVLAMAGPLNRADSARERALLRAEQLNTELQREVAARQEAQAALAEANHNLLVNNVALSRSNDDLQHFASVASHDLQEPLRKIVSFAELLAERFPETLDPAAREYLERVTGSATRMQQLIDDLLRFARVGEPTNLAPVDCNESLARVLDGLHLAVQESGAVITSGPLPVLILNQVQLEQLLQNLIGNALKYRGPVAPEIHIEAVRTPKGWRFTVSDNGIGIDMAYADRIFLVFQRLHPRTAYTGTGIGLAVCKRIVEAYGGRIGVESRPDAGSAFWFTLPVPGHLPADGAEEFRAVRATGAVGPVHLDAKGVGWAATPMRNGGSSASTSLPATTRSAVRRT